MQQALAKSRWILVTLLGLLPAMTCRAADVHGVVTNAVTHQPVAGAQISMANLGFCPVVAIASTVSAADGTYVLQIPSDNFGSIITDATGYAESILNPSYQPIDQQFDIALTPVAAIAGTLYDPSSQPIDFSYVNLIDVETGTSITGAQTYNGGKFAFNDIPPGTYMVCQSNPNDDYRDSCYDHWSVGPDGTLRGTPVTVASGQLIQNVDIHLQTGAAITGTLTDRVTHAPLYTGYLEVTLYTPHGARAASLITSTDATGAYRIAGLAPSDYYVTMAEPFSLSQGYYPQIYGGPDCDPNNPVLPYYLPSCNFEGVTPLTVPTEGLAHIDFDLSSGGVVRGRVVDAATGLGIPGVEVDACTPPNYYSSASATTDASGNYVITHLLQHFTVNTRATGYMDQMWPHALFDDSEQCGSNDPQSNLALATPTTTLSNIDFSLSKGSHVSGVVSGTQGIPAHVAVFLRAVYPPAFVEDLQTDANGAFLISDLTVAPYGTYYTAIAYLDDGESCILYGGIPCGPAWQASDPSTADLSNGQVFTAGLGTVILNLDFQLPADAVFHNGFE